MNWITYLVSNAVVVFLGGMQLLMFVRAVLSWLPLDEDNAVALFVYHVTEIVIFPVRCLLERSETLASLPLDLSFFVTFLLLSLLQTVLMI